MASYITKAGSAAMKARMWWILARFSAVTSYCAIPSRCLTIMLRVCACARERFPPRAPEARFAGMRAGAAGARARRAGVARRDARLLTLRRRGPLVTDP